MMPGSSGRSQHGFTVVERFVLVLIIALFVGVALPYFFNAQDAQIEATVKANMKIAQMAAESYAHDNGGIYPLAANDPAYASYFPGGNRNSKSPMPGNYPINPFSNTAQCPLTGTVTDVEKTRTSAPLQLGQPGAVYYNPIAAKDSDAEDSRNTSYAIQGSGKTGFALTESLGTPNVRRTTLVLSKR